MKNHFADNNIAGAFRADPRGRAGFSLLTVLIIVMAGLTIIGVTFQLTTASSGAGRVSSAHRAKYNLLESGVEMGKAAIKEMMNNDQDPPRHFPAGGTEPATEITKAGDLLLDGGLGVVASETYNRERLRKMGIGGESAEFKVMIYDMQYSSQRMPSVSGGAISSEALMLIPASLALQASSTGSGGASPEPDGSNGDNNNPNGSVTNAGTYLIRSVFTMDGRTTILDAAVIQANMK